MISCNRFSFILFFLIPGFQQLFAQTDMEIRTGDYLMGEAFIIDGDEIQAKNVAKKELVQSIFQIIVVGESMGKEEKNGQINDEYNVNLESFSKLNLRGIHYLSTKNRNDKPYMIAYISVDDYRYSVQQSVLEIISIINDAEKTERINGLPDAAGFYYDAWLKTFSVPDLIKFKPESSADSLLAITFIRKKLTDYLNNIKLQNENIEEELEAYYTVDISASFKGKPVKNLRLTSKDPSIDARPIVDGKGKLHIHRLPGAPQESIELILFPQLMTDDVSSVKLDLANSINVTRKFDVDYSSVISMDYRINSKADNYLEFIPVIRNFSVSKLSWDFGDGYQAVEPNPTHKFESNGKFKIALTVNNEYKIIKETDQTGKVYSTVRTLEPKKSNKPNSPISASISGNSPLETKKDTYFNKIKKDLAEISSGELLFDYLNNGKQTGRLTFGKESQFARPDECLITVVDNKSRLVIAVLEKKGSVWFNQKNNQEVKSVSDQFKGQIVVWVQVF